MKYNDRSAQNIEIEDQTPATVGVALFFMALVGYFIIEHYFTASEYYAEEPPYMAMILSSLVGVILVFVFLKKVEPERNNSALFALLTGLGVGLATYSFIPRLNIITDTGGLSTYPYILTTDHIWKSDTASLPELHLYFEHSKWWRQYEPGDSYTFELRKGGLNIWLVSMSKIYEEQKQYYDCDGVLSCMTK